MSILNKVTSVLEGKGSENYLALLVTYEGVEVALWTIENTRLKILAKGKSLFVGGGNILESTADAIDQACEPLDIEAKEIILGLPDAWISQNQILPQYLNKLKDLAKDLEIAPFAFVSQNHAVANRLKIKYGTAVSGFLLTIDKENVTLSSIVGGQLAESRYLHSENSDYQTALQRLFSQFSTPPAQAKNLYVNGGPSLAALKKIFDTIPLLAQANPEIIQLEPGFGLDALALAGAIDRGNTQGIQVEDMIAENATIAEISPAVEKDASLKEADIAQEKEPETSVQPSSKEDEDGKDDEVEAAAITGAAALTQAAPAAVSAEAGKEAAVDATEEHANEATSLPEGFVAGEDIAAHTDDLKEGGEEKDTEVLTPNEEASQADQAATVDETPQHEVSNIEPIIHEANVPHHTNLQNQNFQNSTKSAETSAPVEPVATSVAHPITDLQSQGSGKSKLIASLGMLTGLLSALPKPTALLAVPKMFGGTFSGRLVPLIIAVVLLFGIALGAFLLLPKAMVTITYSPKVLSNTVVLSVSPNATDVNVSSKVIPGHILTTQVSGTAKGTATGKKKVGDKAKGTVTIFNKTSQSKTFAAGTTLTAGQLSFTIDSSTTVPASTVTESAESATTVFGKSNASVTAGDIGQEGNITNGTDLAIGNLSKSSFSATATGDFTGGSSHDVTVIADADMKAAQDALTQQLKDQAKSTLLAKVGSDQKVLDQSIQIDIPKVNASQKVDDQVANFTVSADANAKALLYASNDLQSFLTGLVKGQVPDGYSLSNTANDTQPTFSKMEKNGDAVFNWDYQAKLLPQVNEGDLKKQLAGKSFNQAENITRQIPNVADATIVVTPSFLNVAKRLPIRSSSITITSQSQ